MKSEVLPLAVIAALLTAALLPAPQLARAGNMSGDRKSAVARSGKAKPIRHLL